MKTSDVLEEVSAERDRQRHLWNRPHHWGWGDCSSPTLDPLVKLAVLSEEFGEVSRSLLDRDGPQLAEELIQLAAVAVAWRESL